MIGETGHALRGRITYAYTCFRTFRREQRASFKMTTAGSWGPTKSTQHPVGPVVIVSARARAREKDKTGNKMDRKKNTVTRTNWARDESPRANYAMKS